VKIDYLKNHPVMALRLAELCVAEWHHLYTGWNREVALREFESQRADGTLPLSRVAIEQVEPHATVEVCSSMFLREEEYRRLQRRTDRLCSLIISSGASQREIQSERQDLRAQALRLFPDRMDLYDMIYESRFDRLWQQFRPG
jgi:hypothetical protein